MALRPCPRGEPCSGPTPTGGTAQAERPELASSGHQRGLQAKPGQSSVLKEKNAVHVLK